MIGGGALIGSRVVEKLTAAGHRPDGPTVVTDVTDVSVGMFAAVRGDALVAGREARIGPAHCTDRLSPA